MILASKEDRYLNCLSEPPAKPEEKEEEEAPVIDTPVEETVPEQFPIYETEPAYTPEPVYQEEIVYAPEPSYETERAGIKEQKKTKAKEQKVRKGPRIVWKNPFDSFTKKVTDRLEQIIDNGYDGMEE